MKTKLMSWGCAGLLATCALLGGSAVSLREAAMGEEAKGPKLELKLAKGDSLRFKVEKASESSGGAAGGMQGSREATIEYSIEVGDKKDGGEHVLKVKYHHVRMKISGGRGDPWEFDSARKENVEGASDELRNLLASSFTVTVSGGEVKGVEGFPAPARTEGGARGDFSAMRFMMYLSRWAMERDMELILSRPAQGQTLEKGKVYTAPRAEPPAGETGNRGGGRFARLRGMANLSYKYEGEEKAGSEATLKFALAADSPPAAEGERGRPEAKVEGKSLVSVKDGLVIEAEFTTEMKGQGRGKASETGFSQKTKTTVTRGQPEGTRL